jgi:hypothetical protein
MMTEFRSFLSKAWHLLRQFDPRAVYQQVLLFIFAWQRAQFYDDLAEMFFRNEAMLSFLEGELIGAQNHRRVVRSFVLRSMLRTYRRGAQASRLSHLLEGVVPKSDSMMLTAIDAANDKVGAFRLLAQAVRQQQRIRRIVLTYCALPLVLMPLCYALVSVMSGVLLSIEKSAPPEIEDQLWSGFNGLARYLAHFVDNYGVIFLCVLSSLVVVVVYTLPRWRGRSRLQFEGWPIYSLYRDFQASLLFSAMALLLKTGGTLKGSLQSIAQRSSSWMRWHIFRIVAALDENPNNPAIAFSRGLVCAPLQARAATLLRTASTLSNVLIELGTSEQTRVLQRVQYSALVANLAVVGVLMSLATVIGIASISVPGSFANLAQPSNLQAIRDKKMYEVEQKKRFGSKAGESEKAAP